MRKLNFLYTLALLLFVQVSTVAQNTVDSQLFGAGWNGVNATGTQPQPWCPQDSNGNVVKLTQFRVWDDGMKWGQIVPTNASGPTDASGYVWTKLDQVVNVLVPNAGCPMTVLYQMGDTPAPAAAAGSATTCAAPDTTNSCRAPSDVNGAGGGADAWVLNFVGQVFNRYGTKIKYWGISNEADSQNFWCWSGTACGGGTDPKSAPNTASQKNLVLMAWDAKNEALCFNPGVKFVSPDGHVGTMATWFHNYVNTTISAPARNITVAGHNCSWGAQTVHGYDTFDIVDEHMRGTTPCGTNCDPTAVIAAYNVARTEMNTTDPIISAYPLWNDEYGYNGTVQAANVQIQAGYASVQLSLMASFNSPNIQVSDWYVWDAGQGPLSQTVVGLAYNITKGWLLGSTVNNFTNVGTIYSITGTTQAGASFKITWDGSKTCTTSVQSSCTTSTQTEAGFTHYADVAGVTHTISGSAPVGWQPIFLTGTGGGTVAATPTFSPNGGTFAASQTVTIATTSGGAILCYTTNGTTPATNGTTGCTTGTLYTTPISVAVNETVKAVAGGSGFTDSAVGSAVFTFHGTVPTFSPVAGTYNGSQTITISNTSSLAMCFTTNGSTPTSNGTGSCSNGTLYTVPIVVAASETVKAIGMLSGWTDSTPGSAIYTINYTLTVVPSGVGTVSSAPIGINLCSSTGGVCSSLFNQGTSITLTATAGSGFSFAGWSGGGCSGLLPCTIALNSTTSVTATFSPSAAVAVGTTAGLMF